MDIENFMNEVVIVNVDLAGVCGPGIAMQYLENRSNTRGFSVIVRTRSLYLGGVVNEYDETKFVPTGVGRRTELGCERWHNPTGADTIYERTIVRVF